MSTLAQTAAYYRKREKACQRDLDARSRFRGRVKVVRERDLWARLADEIETYVQAYGEDGDRPDVDTSAEVPLFG